MTGWMYLGIAIVLEVIATTLLKMANGLEILFLSATSIGFYSLWFLSLALVQYMYIMLILVGAVGLRLTTVGTGH